MSMKVKVTGILASLSEYLLIYQAASGMKSENVRHNWSRSWLVWSMPLKSWDWFRIPRRESAAGSIQGWCWRDTSRKNGKIQRWSVSHAPMIERWCTCEKCRHWGSPEHWIELPPSYRPSIVWKKWMWKVYQVRQRRGSRKSYSIHLQWQIWFLSGECVLIYLKKGWIV